MTTRVLRRTHPHYADRAIASIQGTPYRDHAEVHRLQKRKIIAPVPRFSAQPLTRLLSSKWSEKLLS